MTEERTLDAVIDDIDGCLGKIKGAADIVIDTATGANIPEDLFDRLMFCAQVIDDYADKAGGFTEEAFQLRKKAAAILKEGAA
ncbi:MAG: hypothetical protein EPO10_11940 [Reyranella sp.]|uniref:hypothetical protein n=1 Tax=Reyranella sp. TaxID=1929291 RepID=UPI0011FE6223|nr:hypothetical protein [Reyranella sp.]TAJ91244.1 MAG: hypothetical protein EPO41_15285 [Reyranella sp.]TBR28650.1 MAG: hypothetical protein EPO10_11940 [Reyranella sp.]